MILSAKRFPLLRVMPGSGVAEILRPAISSRFTAPKDDPPEKLQLFGIML